MNFENVVKMVVYGTIADSGIVPDVSQTAVAMNVAARYVQDAFDRLRQRRLFVLEPGDPRRIRMAKPFSAVPTPFLVHARGHDYYANCAWDALGVAAALQSDADIDASDGHTGEPMPLEVRGGDLVECQGVAHFAIPLARWWDDIAAT